MFRNVLKHCPFWLLALGLVVTVGVGGMVLVPDLLMARGNQISSEDETGRPFMKRAERSPLTGEEARKALLELIGTEEPGDGWFRYVKGARLEKLDDSSVSLGARIVCNLRRATFRWRWVIIPKGIHAHDITLNGVFQRAPDGKWKAEVTDEEHAWH